MILLVTNQQDLTTDYIVRELKNRGVSYYRLNTETLPSSECTIGYESMADWKVGGLRGEDVTSAYLRRPLAPEIESGSLKQEYINFLQLEWLAFLKSIYGRLEGKWFSSPVNIALAEDKPMQLVIAKRIGFSIPLGIISNDVDDVISKTTNENLIIKPLRQALIEGDSERVVFTSRVPKVNTGQKKAISFSPSIFQQEIKKKYDVRVTVVGRKVFPVAIWSQGSEVTQVDWRKGGDLGLVHQHIKIPEDIENLCVRLVQIMNLRFGAIDLICDNHGKFWFLEINPNGQWAWIENQTGLPISSSIVDELIKISKFNDKS
ncbi:hypothetical protein [Pseudoalteromonas sp. T1lg10]|uniref:hypothetical protein n=1 Tax=Pseudoalteromonas sp. T1lg10 TaxID=2077093 RepID=UPI000CF6B904|nr:hypothetical protein [Pseudoalteromonas sp. T1lg10]